ncbi:MAG: hypothetical protein KAR19_00835 [Bacteroidales bacterium]|nr:hypothetical protein [Bacteroidales bacterium]
MRTAARNIAIKLASFLMIGMMGMLIANQVIFRHAHRFYDGTVIAHAHPYNNSSDSKPYKSHQHSKAELLFFQNLEILFPFAILTFALLNLVKSAKNLFFRISEYTLSCIFHYKGRAPPVSLYIFH